TVPVRAAGPGDAPHRGARLLALRLGGQPSAHRLHRSGMHVGDPARARVDRSGADPGRPKLIVRSLPVSGVRASRFLEPPRRKDAKKEEYYPQMTQIEGGAAPFVIPGRLCALAFFNLRKSAKSADEPSLRAARARIEV